ncbi:hypothetical protein D5R81_04235 [Parashewanella spongiae]|uniref:Uncharacterized protein n=1 Tax=Parashewanella spongiae TaxID=342950 RepID=A0A3A6TWE6_9GAMM|nr:hypothetical protein [Parashewanella spongiae]MCL1077212.1 hypothetical protein [Parashewanella spongiae]RJY18709.1 hypothetical protein D5R81_04235 [Parashewanella spongiae]
MSDFWKYHNKPPSAGRRLLLLSHDEVIFYRRYLLKIFDKKGCYNDLYAKNIINCTNAEFTELTILLGSLSKISNTSEISYFNISINKHFTDFGWREFRQKLSQYKKREQKSHIIVTKALKARLTEYQKKYQLDSLEQVIDTLLTDGINE